MSISIGVFPGDGVAGQTVEPKVRDATGVYYEVEVYRTSSEVKDVVREVREVELVKPGGTLVNVGHGPDLPNNPYEGQVWILT